MKTYPAYKDSDIEWLGETPTIWNLLRTKYVLKIKKEVSGEECSNYTILALTLKGVIRRDIESGFGKHPAEYNTYQIVNNDELIFCLFDYDVTPRTIGYVTQTGIVTGAYTSMVKQNNSIHTKYYYYYFLSLDIGKELLHLCKGLRNSIQKDTFFDLRIPCPSLLEQKTIATYLDRKTAKIDRLLEIKTKKIKLLKEHRTAIINQAVTKGLNADVKLKDSGIEWLGEVPEHWLIKRLKFVAKGFMYGTSINCNDLETGTPVLRIPNIKNEKVSLDDLKYAKLNETEEKTYLLKDGDILIVRTNGNPKLVGRSALVKNVGKCIFASYLIKITPQKNISPEFLSLSLKSESVQEFLSFSARTSAGNYNLNTQALSDASLAYPPQAEQIQIIEYLESKTLQTDKTIETTQTQINQLKEYRTALISSVVTGKLDVRGEV